MRSRLKTILWVLFVLCALQNASSWADQLRLANGDHISGALVGMENGRVTFQVSDAGTLTFAADSVVRLTTDHPVYVIFADGSTASGTAFFRNTGDTHDPIEGSWLELARITAIQKASAPAVSYSARVNAGGSSERGNTDTDKLNLNADATLRTREQRFNIGGELNREFADQVQTSNNLLAYGNARQYLSGRWYGYGSTMFEHDEFADIDLKTTLGAGAGYQVFESPERNLSLSAGVAYIWGRYNVAENEDFLSGQWAVAYDQYFLDKSIQLFHRQNGYMKPDDTNNWAVKTRQGLRIPIYKGLTTTLQYNYDWNNAPSPEAKEQWDSKIMFLLGYTFGN